MTHRTAWAAARAAVCALALVLLGGAPGSVALNAAEPLAAGQFHSSTIAIDPSDVASATSRQHWRFFKVHVATHEALQFAVVSYAATAFSGNASWPVATSSAGLRAYLQNRVEPGVDTNYDAALKAQTLNGWAGRDGVDPHVVAASTSGLLVGHWNGDNVLTGDWFLGLQPVWTNATLQADRIELDIVILPLTGAHMCSAPPADAGVCTSPASSVMAEPAFAGRKQMAREQYEAYAVQIADLDSSKDCRDEGLQIACASLFGECDENGFAQRLCHDSCADFTTSCLDSDASVCNDESAFTSYSDDCRYISTPSDAEPSKTRKWLLPVLFSAGGVLGLVLIAVAYRAFAARRKAPALLLNGDEPDEAASELRYGQIEG